MNGEPSVIEALAQEPIAEAGADGRTAGAMLRQAREASGLHVAAMAVALKVPVAKLEALEQDRYDLLPDAVFARALASTVCRTLKVDARPILERLPQTSAPRLVQDNEGINAPFRSPRDAVAPNWREQAMRPVSLAVGALLLAAAVVVLLPRTHFEDRLAEAGKPAPAPVPAAVAPAAPAVVEDVKRTEPAPLAAPEPAPSPIVSASMTTPAPAQPVPPAAPGVTTPAAPAMALSSPAVSAPAAAAANGPVVFHASAPSWVEVRDAKGAVPLRKTLAAGESATIAGAMPLQVTVGNVKGTAVDVRGKPFDLQPVARDNVARFEVK
jgi:cytoskeleton protein RodZ